jgi:hypothetical protein
VLRRALDMGLELVAAGSLAIRDRDRFCWTAVPTVPLDRPDDADFTSELPVVAIFHDRDPALGGVGWITALLDRWMLGGARRFVDLRELAAALSLDLRLEHIAGEWWLRTGGERTVALPRPRDVLLRLPAGVPSPRTIATATTDGVERLRVQRLAHGLLRVVLPAG